MANILCYPGFWMRDLDTGIDWVRVVHGEQEMRIHRPLAASGDLIGVTRVTEVVDKGAGKGALVYAERRITDAASGEPVATLLQTVFCRGDGGFGGRSDPTRKPRPLPDRAPDASIELPTHPQLALIYRLSGDLNPLHSDPSVARRAGFDRPILHGLATYGIAGHGLLALLCDYRPERLLAMDGRFSAPVFPGETLRIDIWRLNRGEAAFRAVIPARDATVLTNGHCEFIA
jgi:acyl dehydratase